MPFRGFWETLEEPIIGLSPMDGVTDAAFRHIVCKTSKPSFVITEFVNVEGLARGATTLLSTLKYDEIERPIVAQIYGMEVESFYKVALMCCYLGFDGIDINMGCPARKVARRGSGAGLIEMPETAQKIIRRTQKAAEDWSNGITLEEADMRPKIITALEKMRSEPTERIHIPVSVKTRIGYEKESVETWIPTLLETKPANISLHGRTLKQMYSGEADWNAIQKATEICKGSGTSLIGNGDVQSKEDAKEKIKEYGVDGVLVGRALYGNPWFFSGHEPNTEQRIEAAIEHSKIFEKILPERHFWNMRKHLGWYTKGFLKAREVRRELMTTNSSDDVKKIFESHKLHFK